MRGFCAWGLLFCAWVLYLGSAVLRVGSVLEVCGSCAWGVSTNRYVLRSKSVVCNREAVRTLANLSSEYAYTAALAEGGALMPLSQALTSSDFMTQR